MEKILETIRKNAEVINDSLWYVNPKNIEKALKQDRQHTIK